MGMPFSLRTQDEIMKRYLEIHHGDDDGFSDWLGFRRETLLSAMSLRSLIAVGVTTGVASADEMNNNDDLDSAPDGEHVAHAARDYLTFAVEKILDHRGISATRSVQKLMEYAWLLCRTDVMTAMDAVDYPQYGAPMVKAFADGMGWSWCTGLDDTEIHQFTRMSSGLWCTSTCEMGCGQ